MINMRTMKLNMNRLCVVWLGLGFFCLFVAFNTTGSVETSVVQGFKDEHPGFNGSGYTSLAIIYITFALFNWFAPPIVSVTGTKWALVISSIGYTIYVANFLYLFEPYFYGASVVVGMSAAVLWTAQGAYLALNSSPETVTVNSAIFYGMMQASNLGGLIATFLFGGNSSISSDARTSLFTILLITAGVANGIFIVLPAKPPKIQSSSKRSNDLVVQHDLIVAGNQSDGDEDGERNSMTDSSSRIVSVFSDDNSQPKEQNLTVAQVFVQSVNLFIEKKMLLLFWAFFYTGVELTFFSGVYSTCLGNTAYWSNSKSLVGLAIVFVGVGEISGSLFGGMSRKYLKLNGCAVYCCGSILHLIAFYMVYLNIPVNAPLDKTYDTAHISPNQYLGLFCSFALGFGDACLQTEIMNILVTCYSDRSAPAFALFKFAQSMSCAAGFFYSTYLNLNYQLLILLVSNIVSSLCFVYASFSPDLSVRSRVNND